MAFQMPNRLATVEMPDDDDGEADEIGLADHDEAREARKGEGSHPPGERVAERAHQQRLLEDEAADHAVARADQLEQRDVADLVERERVDDQRDDDGGNDDEQRAEQTELALRLVHHAGEQQVLLLLRGIDRDVGQVSRRCVRTAAMSAPACERHEHRADPAARQRRECRWKGRRRAR
jgi:hypothetical protein